MTVATLSSVTFPNGVSVPALGQGTWYLGENPAAHRAEVDALRAGIDLGLTVIDTAEMYGSGAAESLVGEAIHRRRDDVFLVSKVLPYNASLHGTAEACRRSLARLGTDHLDLYLLHWRGEHPLAATVEAFEGLLQEGLIRGWGVSNFDTSDMTELMSMPGGSAVQTNQILYNLARRGPEFDLLPQCNDLGIPVMGYSPLDHGSLLGHPLLKKMALNRGTTAAQIALAWVLQRSPEVAVMAKASTIAHVRENRSAMDVEFTGEELAMLDTAFPAPRRAEPLEVL